MHRHIFFSYFFISTFLCQSNTSLASWHRIINEATGKCVDAYESDEGKHIRQHDCWGDQSSAPQQFWRFEKDGTIKNKKSGLFLSIGNNPIEISEVIQTPHSGNTRAKWIYCGDFTIQNQARDSVLEVFFGHTENSKHIGYTAKIFRSAPHAKWRVEPFLADNLVKGICLRVPLNADESISSFRLCRDRIRRNARDLAAKQSALRMARVKYDEIKHDVSIGRSTKNQLIRADSHRDRCLTSSVTSRESLNTANDEFLRCYEELKRDFGEAEESDDLNLLEALLCDD